MNESISELFFDIVNKYALSHAHGIPDSIIAATALYFDMELFTFNLKDFSFIPNLKIYQKVN